MASQKTVINIKADKVVKEQAQEVAGRLGISLSTVINSFLKQFIRTEEVTFSGSARMTPAFESLLREMQQEAEDARNVVGPFTYEEARAYLKSLPRK